MVVVRNQTINIITLENFHGGLSTVVASSHTNYISCFIKTRERKEFTLYIEGTCTADGRLPAPDPAEI